MGQENVFYDFLEEKKKTFLGYKNKKFKQSKIDIFVKKMAIFLLFLGNIGQENVFYDILQREKRLSRV